MTLWLLVWLWCHFCFIAVIQNRIKLRWFWKASVWFLFYSWFIRACLQDSVSNCVIFQTRNGGIGCFYYSSWGIILCMRPANERRRYNVTSTLIGWGHSQNHPCSFTPYVMKPNLFPQAAGQVFDFSLQQPVVPQVDLSWKGLWITEQCQYQILWMKKLLNP